MVDDVVRDQYEGLEEEDGQGEDGEGGRREVGRKRTEWPMTIPHRHANSDHCARLRPKLRLR